MSIRLSLSRAQARSILAAAVLGSTAGICAAEDRTITGVNNALQQPNRGSAGTAFIRFGYPSEYVDGVGNAVLTDAQRVNARTISNRLAVQTTSLTNNRNLSSYVWMWGQFLTHDLDLASTSNGAAVNGSANIAVTSVDTLGPNPIGVTRSNFVTINNVRQQVNSVTTWIDASQVYGSDPTRAAALRTNSGTGAKLVTSANNLPGYNTAGFANDNNGPTPANQLFLAGDVRANENVALTSMHTVFIREHNRLVDVISAQQPTLNNEQKYQLARKIVGAEMQAVTYNEFLPAIMGNAAPTARGYNYNPQVPASITQSFATAAFRFAHSTLSSEMPAVNNDGTTDPSLSLANAFSNPNLLTTTPGLVEDLLKGGATQRAQEVDTQFIDEIRNTAFGPPGAGGTDLFAVDTERGRDHGLVDYRQLRGAYGQPPINSFAQIPTTPAMQATLQDLYANNLNNVDAIVAGLAENHLPGQSLGGTFSAIIGNQFARLRDGDRLFYLSNDAGLYLNGVLRPEIASILNLDSVRLSDIIAANTGLTSLQAQGNLFFARMPGDLNNDQRVNAQDIDLLLGSNANAPAIFDVNADGTRNSVAFSPGSDVDHLVERIMLTEFGDANLDRKVDFADLLILGQHYEQQGGWASANFDGNSIIDFTDLLQIAQHYGFGLASSDLSTMNFEADFLRMLSLVPEPSVLATFGGVLLFRRRRAG